MFQFHLSAICIWCTLVNWELDMGEIDTKPIEPVQVGITLFDKSDQRLHRPSPSNRAAHEMEIEQLQKELTSYKAQLQARDVAYSQLLHKLENHQKTEEELSNQLNNTKIERDVYFEEYKEAQNQVDELNAKMKDVNNQLSESGKTKRQLSHVLHELKTIQNEFQDKAREMEKMKKEMEAISGKVGEFRTRAEQARARAEAAERAKMGLEEQLRKMREQKRRRKAALAALREESLSREFGSSSSYDAATRDFQPLGKILNIKF